MKPAFKIVISGEEILELDFDNIRMYKHHTSLDSDHLRSIVFISGRVKFISFTRRYYGILGVFNIQEFRKVIKHRFRKLPNISGIWANINVYKWTVEKGLPYMFN